MWSMDKPFLQLFFRCYQIHDHFFFCNRDEFNYTRYQIIPSFPALIPLFLIRSLLMPKASRQIIPCWHYIISGVPSIQVSLNPSFQHSLPLLPRTYFLFQ